MLRDVFSDLAYRLRALVNRAGVEREMDEELRLHLDREIDRLAREGRSPADAKREAQLAFGGVEQVKELARDAWGTRAIEQLRRDLVHAVRMVAREPAFSGVVALSLALGIGATLTVFNITYNMLFAPLALPLPGQLITAVRWSKDGRDNVFKWSEVQAVRAAPGASIAGMRGASSIAFSVADRRLFTNVDFVDGNFFDLLGARPRQGRLISVRDDAESAPVVVVSHRFAELLYPGDSNVVGHTVNVRGTSFTIIGVTVDSYRGVNFPAIFTAALPLGSVSLLGVNGTGNDNRGIPYGRGDDRLTDRAAFHVIGRRTVEPDVAQSALGGAFARCCGSGTAGNREWLEVVDMSRGIPGGKGDNRRESAGTLAMITAGVALVLVVVCCNIAGLLLVRASVRQREIAVRLSLGASRARLTWQLVAETIPLSVAGGVGGLVLAAWFTSGFVRALPADWTDLAPMFEFSLSPVLLGAAAVLTAVCAAAFAVYPALRATARPLALSLRMDSRASRTRGQGTIARGVVVAQVAVTLVLVTGAALLSATVVNLSHVDAGVATDRTLLAGLETRSTTFEAAGIVPVAEDIARAVEAVPGVRAVTLATLVPLHGGANYEANVSVPGFVPAPGRETTARLVMVRPGYFATSGLRMVAGQELDASSATAGTVVVNEAFVRRYLRDRVPLGMTIRVEGFTPRDLVPVRIVGVSADAVYESAKEPARPYVYLPLSAAMGKWSGVQLVVRTNGPPLATAPAVMKAVEAAAPGIESRRIRDMETQRLYSTTTERLTARLAVFVSVMALVLSAVGLYGVVAYGVSRRVSEIGIRMALGARTNAILWLVSRETVWLVGAGVAAGAAISFVATKAMASQFYGVGPHDPFASLTAVSALACVGVAASLIPARRATRIDPKVALNAD